MSYFQAAALAVVFAGYAIGWRYELVGGVLSIIGTIALAVIYALVFDAPPAIALAWFALPGVLYMAAWYSEHREAKPAT
jgi:hypothetical protein